LQSFIVLFLYYYFRTLDERAQRLFSTKGKSLDEIDPALFAKSKGGKSSSSMKTKDAEKHKELASLEAQAYRYCLLMIKYLKMKCVLS
jgi:splicing factor 3A subunit 3